MTAAVAMRFEAITQWRHPVASSEAQDVLHQAMRPALHHRIRMAIEMPALTCIFIVVNFVVAHNHC